MEFPFDAAGIHALLVQHRLEPLKLDLANTGLEPTLWQDWLTVRFEDAFWLRQRAQAVRNLALHFAPFPYRRFDVRVGGRPASKEELTWLGSVVLTHAS